MFALDQYPRSISSSLYLKDLFAGTKFSTLRYHTAFRSRRSARPYTMTVTKFKKRQVGRRYVIACDGTWQNSDAGFQKSVLGVMTPQVASNVPRIVRAMKHSDGPIQQIAFYQRGIGSDDSGIENKIIGGMTGNVISEHIRESYGFLANNFDPESQTDLLDESKPLDEIVLLGFSRGAFTARAIASLISDVGLLTRRGMENFWGVFGDWMAQDIPGYQSKWFEETFGEKIKFSDPKYRQTLIDRGLTRWGMPIRAVAVWDTVGALGIPIGFKEKNVKELSFVNSKVAQKVQYAFHAIALDEHRNLFTPTMWEEPDQPNDLRLLKQTWFPGVHSNIGGSYPDSGISNITLAWMISQLEDNDGGIVAFNPDYLDFVQDLNTRAYAKVPEPVRPWGLGRLYDSSPSDTIKGIFAGMSPIVRTPGRYSSISTEDGQATGKRLKNTNEHIHRCVRVRINAHGRDTEGNADTSQVTKVLDAIKKAAGVHPDVTYDCEALKNYELVQPPNVLTEQDHSVAGQSGVVWKAKDGLGDLLEDELGATEIRLLKRSVVTALK